jgi:hypothetical protein
MALDGLLGNKVTRWVNWHRRAWKRGFDASTEFWSSVTTPSAGLNGWAHGIGVLMQAWSDNLGDLNALTLGEWCRTAGNGVPVAWFVIDAAAESTDAQVVTIPSNTNPAAIVCSDLLPLDGGSIVQGHVLVEPDDVTSSLRIQVVDMANFGPSRGTWLAYAYEDKLPPPKSPLAVIGVVRV